MDIGSYFASAVIGLFYLSVFFILGVSISMTVNESSPEYRRPIDAGLLIFVITCLFDGLFLSIRPDLREPPGTIATLLIVSTVPALIGTGFVIQHRRE